jgi:NAD(P)H-dependent FMN reductase
MAMSDYLVISSSLNTDSRSHILARTVQERLAEEVPCEWLDLRHYNLPICDGHAAYSNPQVIQITERIQKAKCVLLGIPIYNFAAASTAKNLVELTGKAWDEKLVGFLCAAGGKMSYMSVMSLANSLMLDFRCWIIPRFVYADGSSFDDTGILDEKVQSRIKELAATAIKFTAATR